MGRGYAEHPRTGPHLREHLWRFMEEPSALISLWIPSFRAVGVGWTLHLQGRGYLESSFYREVEAPLDACWVLDAMIGDGGRSIAFFSLTRPRSARPFTVDDVQRLDRLRPWLAHAFRQHQSGRSGLEGRSPLGSAGAPVLSGQMILTSDRKMIFQTASLEQLLRVLIGEPINLNRRVPARDKLPAPILQVLRQLLGALEGRLGRPPRMQVPTAYGIITLEAKWLVPAGALPEEAAEDPKAVSYP